MPSPELLYNVLQAVTRARTGQERAEALGGLIGGPIQGLAVWSGEPGGLLRLLFAAGLAEDAEVDAFAHRPGSPVRQVMLDGEPARVELPGVGSVRVQPYRGRSGAVIGALMVAAPEAAIEHIQSLFDAFGRCLERERLLNDAVRKVDLFDHLAALSSDGVIVATPDGELLAYNEALQQLTGWTPEDVRCHGWTSLAYTEPDERRSAREAIAALTHGAASEGTVRELARKDGTKVRARIWSRLVGGEDTGDVAMLGVIRSAASERARVQRAAWAESQSQVERLATGVAHEFNNLLAAIMGHADLILMHDVPERVERHARTILDSASRGAAISTQVLAFSGAAPTRFSRVDLGEFLRGVHELMTPRIPEGRSLHLQMPAEVPPVDGDAGQLQQIVVNLLNNACAMATERVSLEVEEVELPEGVRYCSPLLRVGTPVVRLRVRDDGRGFSEEALARLFTPFFTERDGGHGVGLPAVRGIVSAHGGAIDVRNEGGAVVDVLLRPNSRPAQILETLETLPGRGCTVWVVDDERTVLEFSVISLEAQGYAVRGFEDVAEVRAALAASPPPDVFVLDVVMPGGGGAAVFDALAASGVSRHVVWTSGNAHARSDLPGAARYFLRKPYTGRTLGRLVRSAWGT